MYKLCTFYFVDARINYALKTIFGTYIFIDDDTHWLMNYVINYLANLLLGFRACLVLGLKPSNLSLELVKFNYDFDQYIWHFPVNVI